MKIIIGSDHGGFQLKEQLKQFMADDMGLDVTDGGCFSEDSVDYPVIAGEVAGKVASGEFEKGVLLCGTGIGISIAANKVKGIRAALCHDHLTAELSAQHNNANVLCLGGRITGIETAKDMVFTWLNTPFEGDRHIRRLELIHKIEE